MRKRILCTLAMVAMSGGVSLGKSGMQGAAPLTVIRAGTLIDGLSESPRKNQLIFVRGGRIEKVADDPAAIPAGAKVINLSNATVLPGLIDAHTHIFLWGEDPAKGAGHLCGAESTRARIRRASRSGDRGCGVRRH